MFHCDVSVGVRVACLATCLLWTGCGESTSSVPAVGERLAEDHASPVWGAVPGASEDSLGVDREQLRNAIDLAGRYLVRVCGDDGRFVYRVNLDPAVVPVPRYNLLRHAGTMYALGVYGASRSDRSAETAAMRAAGFLKNQAIAPLEGREGVLAVWSREEIDSGTDAAEAKLGGAGLGLVALATLERLRPGTTPLDDLRGLGRFILHMQKPDGSFYSKDVPSEGGRTDAWMSLYYPGEAALGLLMLYELDPRHEWREGARRALKYLARLRRRQMTVEPDHWALLATAKLAKVSKPEEWEADRAELTHHAVQVCERMLDDMPRETPPGAIAGCLTGDGRTCPTATRLEGMLAVLPLLGPDHDDLCGRMAPAIDAAIAFLVRAQVPSGPHAGGIPRSVVSVAGEESRRGEVRIDYVQHALCAMLQYNTLRFGSK